MDLGVKHIIGLTNSNTKNIVWCCKANFKTNPPRLETLKEEPYTYFFKYVNYKNDHQTDNTNCLFWKHRFNKE